MSFHMPFPVFPWPFPFLCMMKPYPPFKSPPIPCPVKLIFCHSLVLTTHRQTDIHGTN